MKKILLFLFSMIAMTPIFASTLLKNQMTYTFTDGCGVTHQLTASCDNCSNDQLNDAINAWKYDHYSGSNNGQPCYSSGGGTYPV